MRRPTGTAEDYIGFMNAAKTEREAVEWAVRPPSRRALSLDRKMSLKAGDKVYYNNRGKALMLAVIGSPADHGRRVHRRRPYRFSRLDLKPNPLYEAGDLAYFDTHYYGGIKKYQWTAIPLSCMA